MRRVKSFWRKDTKSNLKYSKNSEGKSSNHHHHHHHHKIFNTCLDPNNPIIPTIVVQTIEYIEKYAINENGLFRLFGNPTDVNSLKVAYEKYETIDLSKVSNPHVVTSVLKSYLRELPEPLFTFNSYEALIVSHGISDADMRLTMIKSIIQKIVPHHLVVLEYLFAFLARVAKSSINGNNMDSSNLAIIFAPTLLKSKSETPEKLIADSPRSTSIIKIIIDNYSEIFEKDPITGQFVTVKPLKPYFEQDYLLSSKYETINLDKEIAEIFEEEESLLSSSSSLLAISTTITDSIDNNNNNNANANANNANGINNSGTTSNKNSRPTVFQVFNQSLSSSSLLSPAAGVVSYKGSRLSVISNDSSASSPDLSHDVSIDDDEEEELKKPPGFISSSPNHQIYSDDDDDDDYYDDDDDDEERHNISNGQDNEIEFKIQVIKELIDKTILDLQKEFIQLEKDLQDNLSFQEIVLVASSLKSIMKILIDGPDVDSEVISSFEFELPNTDNSNNNSNNNNSNNNSGDPQQIKRLEILKKAILQKINESIPSLLLQLKDESSSLTQSDDIGKDICLVDLITIMRTLRCVNDVLDFFFSKWSIIASLSNSNNNNNNIKKSQSPLMPSPKLVSTSVISTSTSTSNNATISNTTQVPPQTQPQKQQLLQVQQQQQQQQQNLPNSDLLEKFGLLLNEVDKVVIRVLAQTQNIELELLYTISQQILTLVRMSQSQSELLAGFAQRLCNRLCEQEKKPIYEIYFELLEVLRDWDQKVITTITSFLLFSTPDKKLNRVLVAGLIIHQLININEYDLALSKMMIDSRSAPPIDFAISLLRFCLVENNYANLSEFPSTFDLLQKISSRSPSEMLAKTLEEIKNSPKEEKKRRISRIRQEDMIVDPPGLREAVIALLQDWLLFSSTNTDQKILIQYLGQVLQISFMKNELYFIKFFRLGLEYALERYAANVEIQSPQYLEIDSWCRFVVMMVKHADPTKLNMLTKVLSVLIKILTKDYENNPSRFNQRPYLRIFENLLVDLTSPDPILEHVSNHILFCFVNALATLQPQKYPGFCFAWLDLLSHKSFMPKLLIRQQKQWFHALLVQHFKFLEPFLRGGDLSEPVRVLYKGTLKVLLLLLHDFPEFLCEYHFSLCDVIPNTCIQLRNLILSAFPRNMRLPDPFTPNLKIDMLPDINQPPKISSNFTASLKGLKIEIDNYFKNRGPYSFLLDLKNKHLLLTDKEEILAAGTKYNVPLINSLVLYIGTLAIPQIQRKSGVAPTPSQSAPMDIFHRLALDLDSEGRYIFFNAIANQLRYPNNHTHYLSCVILFLFSESGQDIIKEQITRVLLERLISNKPHPWGLLITFIELIKNLRYNFWSHGFTKVAPEIAQLFDSVAKSCLNRESSNLSQ